MFLVVLVATAKGNLRFLTFLPPLQLELELSSILSYKIYDRPAMKRRLSDTDADDGSESDYSSGIRSDDNERRNRVLATAPEARRSEAPAKLQRYAVAAIDKDARGSSPAIVCSLPPTCSMDPQTFPSQSALSAHYNSHHAHVCLVPSCRKIFPDNHFLDLHLREFHDPIVALQRENGKKTVSYVICPSTLTTRMAPTHTSVNASTRALPSLATASSRHLQNGKDTSSTVTSTRQKCLCFLVLSNVTH